MYDVSTDFHTAVYDTSPVTRALFRFTDGTILTNEDIHSSGLKIMEAANYEEELTIGTCLSSTLTATFMNYSGLLSGFAFGECDVSLGVKIGTDTFVPAIANTIAVSNSGVMYTGHSTAPYLKADGVATAEQPDFAVHSIVIYDGEVMCIGSDGQTWTTAAWTGTVNTGAFMTQKYVKMASSQLGYDFTDNVLRVYTNQGLVDIFEYAKLGTFIINTPKKRNTNLISIETAYDKMSLFDMSANDFLSGLTYPITLGAMFEAICALVGVDYETSTFTNSTHEVDAAYVEAGTEVTARDILRWIAEAACSFARMTRDGKVELGWFASVDAEIPAAQCFKTDLADYEVSQIDMLEILSSDTSTNATVGTGFNSYVIVNNPFLHGATSVDVAGYGAPIYTKLAAFPAFYPMTVTAVCDWSIQAGDIVTVTIDGTEYSLPIYVQTIAWRGDARVTYESTGSATRGPVDAMLRELFRVQAASEGAVRQGVMYNNVYVSHAEGFVAQATINGEEVTARFNAGELGFYNSDGDLIGGMAVEGGIMAMIAGILANQADGNCYATIGEVDLSVDPLHSQGLFIYRKDHSTTDPVVKIVAYADGTIAFSSDERGYIAIGSDGSLSYRIVNGTSQTLRLNLTPNDGLYIYDDAGSLRIRIDENQTQLEYPVPGSWHGIGVNSTGPYYVKNGSHHYF